MLRGYMRQEYGVSAIDAALVKAVNDGIATSQMPAKTGRTSAFTPQGLSLPEGMQSQETVVGLFERGRVIDYMSVNRFMSDQVGAWLALPMDTRLIVEATLRATVS
eukprot:6994295-Alexandrium_andersonii.AAC.1